MSASEVAARAGVAKPTLYAHGRSKDAVFLACVEAEVERLLTLLHAAEQPVRDLGLSSRVEAITLAIIDHARAHPAAFRLLNVTARHRTSTVAAAVDGALDRVPVWIAAALRRSLPRTAGGDDPAAALAIAVHGAAVALGKNAPWRRAERARLARLLSAGLAQAATPEPPDSAGAFDEIGIY